MSRILFSKAGFPKFQRLMVALKILIHVTIFLSRKIEAKCIDLNVSTEWLKNVWPRLSNGYEEEDIFSFDKNRTAL